MNNDNTNNDGCVNIKTVEEKLDDIICSSVEIRSKVYVNGKYLEHYLNPCLLLIHRINDFLEDNNVPNHHGVRHVRRVASNGLDLIKSFNITDVRKISNIVAACMLHDVDDKKFFHTVDYFNARALLKNNEYHITEIDEIIELITYVSCNGSHLIDFSKIESWKLIPRLADRIEAIGKEGIIRCYQYNQDLKRPLFVNATPRVSSEEDVMRNATKLRYSDYLKFGHSDSMIDHYYDKLLHILNTSHISFQEEVHGIDILHTYHNQSVQFVLFVESVRDNPSHKEIIADYIEKLKIEVDSDN